MSEEIALYKALSNMPRQAATREALQQSLESAWNYTKTLVLDKNAIRYESVAAAVFSMNESERMLIMPAADFNALYGIAQRATEKACGFYILDKPHAVLRARLQEALNARILKDGWRAF